MTFADFTNRVQALVQDSAQKLKPADRDTLIKQAIQQRYSKDRPYQVIADVVGNATAFVPVPAAYEDGFSVLRSIEYPIGNVPPTYLDEQNFNVYRQATNALKILLLSVAPTAAEQMRVTLTQRHAADGTTVYAPDFEAVCDYAASLCCDALAQAYAQTRDAAIQADTVNYRSKSQEYLGLAKNLRKRYDDFMGIADSGDGPGSGGSSSTPAAIAIGDLDEAMESGIDRITHGRLGRR